MDILRVLGVTKKRKSRTSSIHFYNTFGREKQLFVPLDEKLVKMYNCGPTVYDDQHIGNLRAYVIADLIKRVLNYRGFPVRQVINITDVGHLTGESEGDADRGEDKVEAGAKRAGVSAKTLTERITKSFKKDLELLNIDTSSVLFPRASDFVREQIALIETLEERGYTYKTSDGIYFDTARFPEYGVLGGTMQDEVMREARIRENPEKRSVADFALWKFSPLAEKEGEKRQQEWESPWGKGFPGWHLECTAMVFAKLGRQIDIHTGGVDHIAVHHNNEIAQAESITKRTYVKYWLHHAHITIEGTKISKSLGNTVLLRQIKDRGIAPLAYRYWLLSGHYRSPLNFTWEALEGAERAFSRLLRLFVEELGNKSGSVMPTYQERFGAHIDDDLDTPGALSVLWELVRDDTVEKKDKRATLLDFDRVLGLGLIEGHRKMKAMLAGIEKKVSVKEAPESVQTLLMERQEARKNRAWERADQIRMKIESLGFDIVDTKEGPEIRRRKTPDTE
jgi:cysteinyl-tRNA synthetase